MPSTIGIDLSRSDDEEAGCSVTAAAVQNGLSTANRRLESAAGSDSVVEHTILAGSGWLTFTSHKFF